MITITIDYEDILAKGWDSTKLEQNHQMATQKMCSHIKIVLEERTKDLSCKVDQDGRNEIRIVAQKIDQSPKIEYIDFCCKEFEDLVRNASRF